MVQKDLLERLVKYLSATHDDVWHRMDISFRFVLNDEESLRLLVKLRLWNRKRSDCLVHIVHRVGRDADPWREVRRIFLLVLVSECLLNSIRKGKLELQERKALVRRN